MIYKFCVYIFCIQSNNDNNDFLSHEVRVLIIAMDWPHSQSSLIECD